MTTSLDWGAAAPTSRYFPVRKVEAEPAGRASRTKRRGRSTAQPRKKLWKKVEQPFHSTPRMVRDCQQAIDDPGSWLTHGYTAALHLRYLLERQGAMRPTDWSAFPDDEPGQIDANLS